MRKIGRLAQIANRPSIALGFLVTGLGAIVYVALSAMDFKFARTMAIVAMIVAIATNHGDEDFDRQIEAIKTRQRTSRRGVHLNPAPFSF